MEYRTKRRRNDLTPIEKYAHAEKRRKANHILSEEQTFYVLLFHGSLLPITKKDFDRSRSTLSEKLVSYPML